jgi:hypothetical protein
MKYLMLILAFFIAGCDGEEAAGNATGGVGGVGCCFMLDRGYLLHTFNAEGYTGARCPTHGNADNPAQWFDHYTCEQLCEEFIEPRSNDEYTYTCSINGEPYPPEE